MLRQVANSYCKFLFKENIIFPIFHGHKNTQFNNLSYFGKLQILGCYNSTPLKMNLVLEIRSVLTHATAGMFFLDPENLTPGHLVSKILTGYSLYVKSDLSVNYSNDICSYGTCKHFLSCGTWKTSYTPSELSGSSIGKPLRFIILTS